VQRRRYGQLPILAGRLAIPQLQTLKVDVLPAGQAHVPATGPPATATERDGRYDPRVCDVLLDRGQRAVRPAVGERAVGESPVAVPVLMVAVRLEVCTSATSGV